MQIEYKNKRIERVCTNASAAERQYGIKMACKIHMRIDEIAAADNVEELIQWHIGRCHALANNRKGQYAVDLVHPNRLVFTIQDGLIQIACIQEIVDYH